MRFLVGVMAGIVVMMMFGGCGARPGPFVVSNVAQTLLEGPDKFVVLMDSNSNLSFIEKHIWAFHLQEECEYGLKHGYGYFAVEFPNEISNTKGGLYNNYQDIYNYCHNHTLECGVDYRGAVGWQVIYYKKQQLNVVTYDSQKILKYLKEHNLFFKLPKNKNIDDARFRKHFSYEYLSKMLAQKF